MSSTIKHLADSGIAQILPSNPSVLEMIGAAMVPVVHTLLQQKAVLVQEKRSFEQTIGQLQQQVQQQQTQLSSLHQVTHTMRKQQVSDATFPPLIAVALAQVSQQLHVLGQFLAAGYSRNAKRGSIAGKCR